MGYIAMVWIAGQDEMLRHQQPEWVRSPHESRPDTYYGRKFRQYSRCTSMSDFLILAWLGIVLLAALGVSR